MIADIEGRPLLARAATACAARVWTDPPNPLTVWTASIHGERHGLAVLVRAAGSTENEALNALEALVLALGVEAETVYLLSEISHLSGSEHVLGVYATRGDAHAERDRMRAVEVDEGDLQDVGLHIQAFRATAVRR